MTPQEHKEKILHTIREFSIATRKVEAANASMNEVAQKMRDLLGTSSKNMNELKDLALAKIGSLHLEEMNQELR